MSESDISPCEVWRVWTTCPVWPGSRSRLVSSNSLALPSSHTNTCCSWRYQCCGCPRDYKGGTPEYKYFARIWHRGGKYTRDIYAYIVYVTT